MMEGFWMNSSDVEKSATNPFHQVSVRQTNIKPKGCRHRSLARETTKKPKVFKEYKVMAFLFLRNPTGFLYNPFF